MDQQASLDYLESVGPEVQKRAENDMMFFLKSLKIPSGNGPLRYAQCMADFQVETFTSLAPSLEAVRKGDKPPIRRFWIERTKKSGKDSDIAACLVWLMAFPKKPIKVQVCAANSKQAGIIRNRAVEILYYNPWLEDRVEIIESEIRNKQQYRQVWTHIEATDSQGAAHGETPDLLVLNELVHVAKWRAMEDHMANADGVPRGVVIISTNAGIRGTKAHTWRKTAIEHQHRWKVLIWDKVAPWISPEDIAEAKKRDPIGSEFRRLWMGQWVSGTGGAVTDEDIEKCFTLDGPLEFGEPGWSYFAGLDLGVSHDHAAVAVIGVNRSIARMRVATFKDFKPSIMNAEGALEVDLQAVEEHCLVLFKRFHILYFAYDPAAGGSFMAQRLHKRGVNTKKVNFQSPVVQSQMATAFVQVVKDQKLECYEDGDGVLKRDFGKFTIENKLLSGYKLQATSDEFGHADVGVAIIMVLPRVIDELGGFGGLYPDDDIAIEPGMTETDLENMPMELRDIFDDGNPFGGGPSLYDYF